MLRMLPICLPIKLFRHEHFRIFVRSLEIVERVKWCASPRRNNLIGQINTITYHGIFGACNLAQSEAWAHEQHTLDAIALVCTEAFSTIAR